MDAVAKRNFPTAGKGRGADAQAKDGPRSTVKAIGPYVQCNICGRLCSRRGHIKYWSAEQEMLLVDGIAKYGLGNWPEISDMVSMTSVGYKPWEECQQHYYNIYLNSPTAPLPDMTSVIHGPNGEPIPVPRSTEVPPEEDPQASQPTKPANKPQVVGYWPLRGDFDIEYDNDAELILADMEFRADDTPEQIELKLKVIEIYNSKLDERIYRKKIIISRGLLDAKALQQKERRYTGEEKELYNILRPFLRFQTVEEHDYTVRLLVRERKLRTRLFQLMTWRALGLEKIEDISKYEDRMVRIDAYKEQMKHEDPGRRVERRLRNPQVDQESPTFGSNKMKLTDFLEEKEMQFCEALQLPPVAYFLAKRVMLHELACNPSYTIDDMCNELKVDGTKHGRIFDLLLTLSPRCLGDIPNQVADLSKATLDSNGFLSSNGIASQMVMFSPNKNSQRTTPNRVLNYFTPRDSPTEKIPKQHKPN
eukprot:XP_001611033.1 ADA2-like protein [Babesia bovis T2Bo]